MDCKEFREILDLYVDEELSPDALTAAHLHLKECPACRRTERELLRLRQSLKLVVSRSQPPPELVSAVEQLSQPRWRKLRSARRRKPAESAAAPVGRPIWRGNVTIPAPAFMLLLAAVIAFGVWAGRWRTASAPTPSAGVQSRTATIGVAEPATPEEAIDFSRFDHGGRASLYKVRR